MPLAPGGAVGVDGFDDSLEVLREVGVLEVGLAEGNVDDALLVSAELNLATLELIHGGDDVGGDGASLGVGHETLVSPIWLIFIICQRHIAEVTGLFSFS